MNARSRFGGGIGANVFTSTTQSCPPGEHWVDTAATAIRSVGVCVPNVKPLTLHLGPSAAAAPPANVQAPAPAPPILAPAPSAPTADASPAPSAPLCPTPYPLWWLLVAFALGAAGGHYYVKNEKKVKKNAGRIAGHAASRAVNAGVARLMG